MEIRFSRAINFPLIRLIALEINCNTQSTKRLNECVDSNIRIGKRMPKARKPDVVHLSLNLKLGRELRIERIVIRSRNKVQVLFPASNSPRGCLTTIPCHY